MEDLVGGDLLAGVLGVSGFCSSGCDPAMGSNGEVVMRSRVLPAKKRIVHVRSERIKERAMKGGTVPCVVYREEGDGFKAEHYCNRLDFLTPPTILENFEEPIGGRVCVYLETDGPVRVWRG